MKAINLMSLGDYPEDFIDMKRDIEEKQLKDGTITEKLKFPDFLASIAAGYVYKQGETVIPFTINEGAESKYLVYTLDEKDDDKIFDTMIERLKQVKFDTSKLTELTPQQVLSTLSSDKTPVFIIKNKYFV